MARHDISPAFVEIAYQSAWGRHKARIPSVDVYINPIGGGGLNDWLMNLRGAEASVGCGTAVKDFLALWKVAIPNTTTFDTITLYQKADAEHAAVPVAQETIEIVGTEAKPSGWSNKATQLTMSFRTSLFGKLRLVALDVNMSEAKKLRSLTGQPGLLAIRDYVIDPSSWIAGQDGGAPASFAGASYTLNDRLERAYNR